jgi:hypothetical protein
MSIVNPAKADAPIPGENYTSDTRNYPWHRPPDIVDIDEAVEYISTNLIETNDGMRYMAMLDVGIPVSAITDMVVTMGVGDGKFTPDFALLIAGPVARLLTVMAKSYNIDYEMGLETGEQIITPAFFRAYMNEGGDEEAANEAVSQEAREIIEEEAPEAAGIMSPAPQDEQAAMLGYASDEEEEQIDG